jgi:hypothetical protein
MSACTVNVFSFDVDDGDVHSAGAQGCDDCGPEITVAAGNERDFSGRIH